MVHDPVCDCRRDQFGDSGESLAADVTAGHDVSVGRGRRQGRSSVAELRRHDELDQHQ